MLSSSDKDIKSVMSELSKFGVEAAYIVPTETGLRKSILDAHEGFRNFLNRNQIHNYETQSKGPDSKVTLEGYYLNTKNYIKTKITLYRPETKSGDPRIWFSKLSTYASPQNLIAVFVYNHEMYVVNTSDEEVWNSRDISSSPFYDLLAKLSTKTNDVESELLGKLVAIHKRGFVPSTTNSDSGVGDTLEQLLGILRNSNAKPDYKGIELKCSRISSRTRVSTNRNTLFSKVPNWELSALKNGEQIIKKFGYFPRETPDLLALHVTLSNRKNAQNLFLAVDNSNYVVENLHEDKNQINKVVLWKLNDLESELERKHEKTFWIKAETKKISNVEHFQYRYVEATTTPMVSNFGTLVETGSITMDYTFSEKVRESGKKYTRDHGYLWKIHPSDFDLLFPPKRVFDLSNLQIA
jgi:hypothetical protein